jgi:hypothetical protein
LRRLERPDEPVLRALRSVNAIEVIHPARLSPRQAQRAWRHYLHHQGRWHTFWLGVNLLISPLTILLAILPGPNVIGYWFVYRAVCNGLAMLGARRGLAEKRATRFTPETLLDTSLSGPETESRAARIAERWGVPGLREFLERLGGRAPRPESAASAPQASALPPPED